jgi:DNA-nicking Smr family endonuclease
MKRIRKLEPKRRRESEADPLFRASVADVVPLRGHDRVPRHHPLPKPRPRPRHAHDALGDDLSDHLPYTREAGEPLKFTRPGLQQQAVRKLRRGGSAIEKELDLHGMTIAQARPLLVAFLNSCSRNGLRHVRIVHGKGLRS